MIKVNVTDNTLLTVLVPGGVVALAFGLLSLATDPGLGTRVLEAVAQTGAALDFDRGAFTAAVFVIGLLTMYVVAMVLGAIVASVAGYMEAYLLDRWCWRRLKLDETQYQLQWKRYVAHLEDHDTENSYIAKQARSFHFGFRSGRAVCGV